MTLRPGLYEITGVSPMGEEASTAEQIFCAARARMGITLLLRESIPTPPPRIPWIEFLHVVIQSATFSNPTWLVATSERFAVDIYISQPGSSEMPKATLQPKEA